MDEALYKSTIATKLLETAQDLNIKTVAEGAETLDNCESFRSRGADLM